MFDHIKKVCTANFSHPVVNTETKGFGRKMRSSFLAHKKISKSVLILLLAALAIFQISHLWFVNLTNRNFFMYLEARFAPSTPGEQIVWSFPYRMIHGVGENLFTVKYSNIALSHMLEYKQHVLRVILQSGTYVGSHDSTGWIKASKGVLLSEYAFPVSADTFSMSLGRRNGASLTNHDISYFESIAVVPPNLNESVGTLRVFFIYNETAHEFNLTIGTRQHPIDTFIFSSETENEPKFFHYFDGSFFVPLIHEHGIYYQKIIPINPHLSNYDQLHMSTIRPQIEHFFTNPAAIHSSLSTDENIYTFSTTNTMVRYLPFDVIEFTSYRTIGRATGASLLGDFSAAIAFIENDHNVINEVFLTNVETRGRENVFLFNYVINDFPIVLTDKWPTGPTCNEPLLAAIEVIVDHGRVIRYRRIAVNFELGDFNYQPSIDSSEPFFLLFPINYGVTNHGYPINLISLPPEWEIGG